MKTFLLFITLSLLISCGKDDPSSDVTPISKYTLSVTSTDGGEVSSTGGSYNEGSSVTITASPNSEYIFENWSNGSTENPLTITVNQNISLTANFVKRKYPLTINIQGEGTVREEIVSSDKSSDPTEYNSGTTVRLTAVPSGEWNVFDSWTGDINDENSIIEFIIDEPKEITVNFEESSLILKSNVTTIDNSSISSQDVMRSFYTVSGVFPYVSDGVQYMFYPGSSDWVAGFSDNLTKNDIPPMPSQILRKIDGGWEFFKTDLNAYFWGARNFEIIDNYIAIGDGNEIGPDGPSWSGEEQTDNNWNGDLYFGEIVGGGNINWTKVNSIEDRIYSHGTTIGDINGDGLLDVGSAPNAGQNTLKIYTQELDGTFTNNDDLLQLVDNRQPFTLDFSDLDNDGIDEIITANYGGGDPSQDPLLNNIRVYKYSSSSEQFEINFMSNNSTAFYDIGLGATSILTEDFDGDGIKDIVVAREDIDGHSFEIWKGISDGSYVPHFSSPVWTYNELQFREFRIFDVNNDGFLDIILRPFQYGNLYRNNSDCWWNVKQCNGIKLNTIIQINNGDGTFSSYDREELIIDSIDVDNVHPYMENGILHFIGTYPYNVDDQYFDYQLSTYDIKVRILN